MLESYDNVEFMAEDGFTWKATGHPLSAVFQCYLAKTTLRSTGVDQTSKASF